MVKGLLLIYTYWNISQVEARNRLRGCGLASVAKKRPHPRTVGGAHPTNTTKENIKLSGGWAKLTIEDNAHYKAHYKQRGRLTSKVVPSPNSLVTVISPP